MIYDPSPEEIQARIEELDAQVHEAAYYESETDEWYDEATERVILQMQLIRHIFRQDPRLAVEGLVEVSHMAERIAVNLLAELGHETVVGMVKDKLEVLLQKPFAVEETSIPGVLAFRPDNPRVPDPSEFT